MTKIGFKDLSLWLKIAVVGSWITFAVFMLNFIIGFIEGTLYYS